MQTRNYQGLDRFISLLPLIVLLWGFLYFRWHNIAEYMPFFIDEIHHFHRGRAVWAFNDLHTSTTPGKFLLYYWLGVFGIPQFPDLWLVRTPTALLALIGAAGTFALARSLFNRRAGLLALLILVVFPFTLFYERMALTDPLTASLIVLMAWWSVIVARKPTLRNATVLAVIWCLMFAAKVLSMPLVITPFLAVALLGDNPIQFSKPIRAEISRIWQSYKPVIMRASLIIVVVWGTIIGFYQIRKILDPNIRAIVDDYLYGGTTKTITGHEQLRINLERFGDALQNFWSVPLVVLTILTLPVLFWKRRNIALFLTLNILVMWVFVLMVAGQLNSRYLSLVGQLCAVLIAGGVVMTFDYLHQKENPILKFAAWLPPLVIGIWVISFGLPFAYTATIDPVGLALPRRDQSEYFRNHTGFALEDSLQYLANSPAISENVEVPVVVTFVRVCRYLPHHMPVTLHPSLQLECQVTTKTSFEERYDFLQEKLDRYGAVYLMVEQHRTDDDSMVADPQYINGDMEFLVHFDRPHDGVDVDIYAVYANHDVGQ